MFLLFRLISALWKAIGGLLGWTDNSCENLLKKEGNCKKLKKVLKDVRWSSEELVGGKRQIRKTIEEKPKPSHSESQNAQGLLYKGDTESNDEMKSARTCFDIMEMQSARTCSSNVVQKEKIICLKYPEDDTGKKLPPEYRVKTLEIDISGKNQEKTDNKEVKITEEDHISGKHQEESNRNGNEAMGERNRSPPETMENNINELPEETRLIENVPIPNPDRTDIDTVQGEQALRTFPPDATWYPDMNNYHEVPDPCKYYDIVRRMICPCDPSYCHMNPCSLCVCNRDRCLGSAHYRPNRELEIGAENYIQHGGSTDRTFRNRQNGERPDSVKYLYRRPDGCPENATDPRSIHDDLCKHYKMQPQYESELRRRPDGINRYQHDSVQYAEKEFHGNKINLQPSTSGRYTKTKPVDNYNNDPMIENGCLDATHNHLKPLKTRGESSSNPNERKQAATNTSDLSHPLSIADTVPSSSEKPTLYVSKQDRINQRTHSDPLQGEMNSSMAQSHLGTNGKKPLKIKMHGKQEFQSPGTSRIIRKGGTRPKENKNGQPPDYIKARDANCKKVKVNNGTTIDPEFVSTSSDNSKNKIPKYYLEQGSNGTSGIKRPYINIGEYLKPVIGEHGAKR